MKINISPNAFLTIIMLQMHLDQRKTSNPLKDCNIEHSDYDFNIVLRLLLDNLKLNEIDFNIGELMKRVRKLINDVNKTYYTKCTKDREDTYYNITLNYPILYDSSSLINYRDKKISLDEGNSDTLPIRISRKKIVFKNSAAQSTLLTRESRVRVKDDIMNTMTILVGKVQLLTYTSETNNIDISNSNNMLGKYMKDSAKDLLIVLNAYIISRFSTKHKFMIFSTADKTQYYTAVLLNIPSLLTYIDKHREDKPIKYTTFFGGVGNEILTDNISITKINKTAISRITINSILSCNSLKELHDMKIPKKKKRENKKPIVNNHKSIYSVLSFCDIK